MINLSGKKSLLYLLAVLGVSSAIAGSVTLTPVRLEIAAGQQVTNFNIYNQDSSKAVYQITAFSWQQKNGKDIETPTNDVIITPPIVTIQGKAEQVVRVGLRYPANSSQEASYRVIVQEVPLSEPSLNSSQTGIHMLLKMSMPLFIKPAEETRQLNCEIKSVKPSSNLWSIRLVNNSNVHVIISDFQLANVSGSKITTQPNISGVILSKQSKEWQVAIKQPLPKEVKLSVATNWPDKDQKIEIVVPTNSQ